LLSLQFIFPSDDRKGKLFGLLYWLTGATVGLAIVHVASGNHPEKKGLPRFMLMMIVNDRDERQQSPYHHHRGV